MTSQSSRLTSRLKRGLMLCLAASAFAAVPASAQLISPTPVVLKTQQARPGSLADLVERISPAVVNIKVTTDTGETTSEGQGSGFIISPQGEVVTNYHVIEGGDTITVVFNNDTRFPARIIGTDEETDLALLKIDSPQAFPAVPFYQGAPIRIGDWVIAIGNPFGIGQSTSLGIISAIGRDRVESGAYVDYIQTDATINRGNSGGPLFNPQGQVVGVNSAIFSPTGASVGIAFSIPYNTAQEVVTALRTNGRVSRGWLGAGLRTAELSRGNSASPHSSGAIVNNIVAGSPAHVYGLRIDDIIMRVNGTPVADSLEATRLIGRFKPGQQVQFDIERNEQVMPLRLQVAERPAKDVVDRAMNGGSVSVGVSPAPRGAAPQIGTPSPAPTGGGTIGMSLVDLSSTFRKSIGMRADQVGVYVERVDAGSHSARKGVEGNMVLLEMDSQPISSVSAFRSMIAKARQANAASIMLLVRTINGSENYVSVPI